MIQDIGTGITNVMYYIKLLVYDDGDEKHLISIDVSIISSNTKNDCISAGRVGYNVWEHTLYAETEYTALKKLLKYRKYSLHDYIESSAHTWGTSKTTDTLLELLESDKALDLHPDLYI